MQPEHAAHPTQRYRLTLLDKINVCLQSVGDYFFHFIIEPNRPLDIQRFRQALRLSMEAEPIFACKYVYHPWRAYWERLAPDFLDRFELCELVQTEDVNRDMLAFQMEPMHNGTEPFIRGKIFRDGTDHVCLKMNCIAVDGAGTFFYIKRLLDIYNQLSTNPTYAPEPSDMALRSAKILKDRFSKPGLLRMAYLGAKNHFLNRKTKNNWRFPSRESVTMEKTHMVKRYGKETVAALNTYRKRVGATVNDIMLAAYYRALYDLIQPEGLDRFCILNTFDLRKHLGPEQHIGVANYSSYVNTNVQLSKAMPFEEIIRRVQAHIKSQKDNYPGLVEAPYVWAIFAFLPFAASKRFFEWLLRKRGDCVPVLTNAGYLDPRRFSLDGVPVKNAYIMAPLTYPPKLTLCLCTCGDNLTLSSGYSQSHFKKEDLEGLVDHMVRIIHEECNRTAANRLS